MSNTTQRGMSRNHLGHILRHITLPLLALGALLALAGPVQARTTSDTQNIHTRDLAVVDDAFTHGYTHNQITDLFGGRIYRLLSIQCTNNKQHSPQPDALIAPGYSVWTRDLYWGFLGWSQAGDDQALTYMESSLDALRDCLHRNRATGQSKAWPLNDGRSYIPQAFCKGGAVAMDFFPWCSESQCDFLLLADLYWRKSGDTAWVRAAWPDLVYVAETIRLMDQNGNALPDQAWGSYDYQGIGLDTEEPNLCAKAAGACRAVAELARVAGHGAAAPRLEAFAARIQRQMNKPVDQGGLWKPLPDGGGYYVNFRKLGKSAPDTIDERFIPYENLIPLFFDIPTPAQSRAIFAQLDGRFDQLYPLKYGPMYTAVAVKNETSEAECSSTPWLAFLDVYLRCRLDHQPNRSRIFKLLIDHARDIPAAPFTEGMGIFGNLTGGAGRAWDNGNFFHSLVNGIYGLNKDQNGLTFTAPVKMADFPLTELTNLRWRDAEYDVSWRGEGAKIRRVLLDGHPVPALPGAKGQYRVNLKTGAHKVTVELK